MEMAEIFDKVKQGIGKGVTTVSVKSKEMIETTRLKGEIDALQQRKKGSLEELGNIIYTMFLHGSFEEQRLREKCEAIGDLDNLIKDKQEELHQVILKTQEILGKPVIVGKCECGAEISASAKFCGRCGKKLTPES
jgi:NADH pyrophosphatase NudC (nudix superfamily)